MDAARMAPDLEATPANATGGIDDAIPDPQSINLSRTSKRPDDDDGLKDYLAQHGIVPTQEDTDAREAAIETLRQALCYNTNAASQQPTNPDGTLRPSDIPLVLVTVGSFGLGVWTAASDIDCLVVGMLSPKTFWALVRQRLGRAGEQRIRILRIVKAASGTMSELKIHDIRVDLQYCPATKVTETWPRILELPPSDPTFDLSPVALRKLNAYRDMHYLLQTIPDLEVFRLAHRFLRHWGLNRGVYASRFGYLGGIHITLLLARICKLLVRDTDYVSASDVVRMFFHSYAEFDWTSEVVFDPSFHSPQPQYQRSAKEPLVILSLHNPITNIAQRASMNTAKTLSEELRHTVHLLADSDITWSKVAGVTADVEGQDNLRPGVADFINNYKSYIKINVQYWGSSSATRDRLLGWLESRCVLFLADLDRHLPHFHARIWPARFTDLDTNYGGTSEYQGYYLVGLAKEEGESDKSHNSIIGITHRANRTSSLDTLQTILQTFADQIRSNKHYSDPSTSWIEVSHVKQSELGDLKLDERQLGDYILEDIDDDSEDNEDAEDEDILFDDMEEELSLPKRPSRSQVKTHTGPSGPKLRPAPDILNRLRWDPNLDSSDYVVGYEDRFLGTREIPLDKWKSEQTDEEFIPQHRIVYFKKRSDGVIVWDKEKRVDKIFGSGFGSGTKRSDGK